MVDSCHGCSACQAGFENYCEKGFLANMRDPKPENNTFGGYSEAIVVREDFVLKIPAGLDPAKAAPLKLPLMMQTLITDRRSVGSTLIGSIKETQELLDFCGQNSILPETKLIPIDDINRAYDEIDMGEIDFRYVIDMKSLAGKTEDSSLAAKVGL
jgi:D-arabinose 1-dehydrogenase-like Zn-dependent alcohol dehydrogenase